MDKAGFGDHGFLKISNENDRITVSSILYKNGYSVSPVRKKNKKTFEYYIEYEKKPMDIQEGQETT